MPSGREGQDSQQPALKRSLSLPLLTLYGLGTTIGAGIYVLVGKVAAEAQSHVPLAFLMASLLVAFSALSFSELSSRFPRSAGEAIYVHEGFGRRHLALATGLLVVLAGLVSCATISRGFVGYLQAFVEIDPRLALVLLILGLGALAAWGIGESVSFAAVLTLIEIAGLVFVIWSGKDSLVTLPARWREFVPPAEAAIWLGIFSGGVVAFYAFIGFEDMVNVAEEVKDVSRTLPLAIVTTLFVTTAVYLALGLVAVLTVAPAELAASDAPIALIIERSGAGDDRWISIIAILAVLNGALIQIIMASRVLYGLASRGWLPARLASVHPGRKTPILATSLATLIVLGFALALPLETLARATSLVTLAIFALVNLALWVIKGRDAGPSGAFVIPRWLALCGFLACCAVLAAEAVRLISL